MERLNLCRVKRNCLDASTPAKKYSSLLGYHLSKIIPKEITDNVLNRIYCLFSNKETLYVNHLTNGVSKERFKMFLRDKKPFNETTLVEFENYKFPAPINYDDVLTKHYGDYMTLPLEEERTPHHGIIKIEIDKSGE